MPLPNHPSKQIHLGNHPHSPNLALNPLSNNSSTIPLKELIQIRQCRLFGNLHKLPPPLLTPLLRILRIIAIKTQTPKVFNNLVQLAEVKHDGFDGGFGGSAAGGDVGEEVAEGDEADEAGFARGAVDADRELVEALFAHGFYGFAAGRRGGDGGDGFEAQRGDGGAVEGVGFFARREPAEVRAVGVGG